ncbi:2'-5' RNA ligase family protein [Spirulina subsalsa FACHB-351]|uniref:2'-5' RNA ligase family protein n=1 Tax=Spirulina subsalsa FACHB-351 TaxID=234711 RepID=A0ABT3L1Y9_9CYAN|nr:2'-5' RNA ligase family protein [Spirulina subsalsa]MCW6035498.1 2'-5' RNA ligase family protein [Spirulina subsalsa FACHB-351]
MFRYFLALLPPVEVQQQANELKEYFARVYDSRKAFNAPPHITLYPPFLWSETRLAELTQILEQFALNQKPIPIVLDGFGAFKPRVIFLRPRKTPELMEIEQTLGAVLMQELGLVTPQKNRFFNPHLTLAFRDLTRDNFKAAWSEFETREFHAEFTVNQLTLLRHQGHHWQIEREFALNTVTGR